MTFPPNWKDSKAYPDPRSTSLRDMAWEFLRRNPKYQDDYRQYAHVFRALLKDYSDALTNVKTWWVLERDPRARIYDPPKLPRESEEAWTRRVGRGSITSMFEWYARRWGMDHRILDPANDCAPSHWTRVPGPVTILAHRGFDAYLFRQDGKIGLGFDLSFPLGPQFKAALSYLQAYKTWFPKKPNPEKPTVLKRPNRGTRLVELLRVLDGEAAGATIRELGTVIFFKIPNDYPDYNRNRTVKNALKAAKEMREVGYIDLLMVLPAAVRVARDK